MEIRKGHWNNLHLAVASILFILLSLWVTFFSRLSIDLPVGLYLQNINNPPFHSVMWFVSWVGDTFMLELIIILAVLGLIKSGLKYQALSVLFSTSLSALAGIFIKMLVSRSRPDPALVNTYKELLDKSFPSNHVLIYTVFFGLLLYMSHLYLKNSVLKLLISLVCLFMIVSISFSRIYLGAHWASDTIGGYLLGYIFINVTLRYAKR